MLDLAKAVHDASLRNGDLDEDWREARKRYRIVRHYFSAAINKREIMSGLTRAEAEEHCANPETSSSTARGKVGRARTRKLGQWFDGFEEN